MDDRYVIAANLAFFRKQHGYSQLELAQKLNYSNKNISKWENGETTPNVFILKKIAELYGIGVDDLLADNTNNTIAEEELQTRQIKRRKKLADIAFLLLANAILFSVASVVIYILGSASVEGFNKWLMYLYITPLSAISIYVFIRVKKRFVEAVSLSAVGWLICACIYATFPNARTVQLVFLLGLAYEALVICVALVINSKLINKMAKKLRELKAKKKAKD